MCPLKNMNYNMIKKFYYYSTSLRFNFDIFYKISLISTIESLNLELTLEKLKLFNKWGFKN